MAVDKLVDSTQLDADLTSVADAIRAKSGGSSQLAFPSGFVSEIGNISGAEQRGTHGYIRPDGFHDLSNIDWSTCPSELSNIGCVSIVQFYKEDLPSSNTFIGVYGNGTVKIYLISVNNGAIVVKKEISVTAGYIDLFSIYSEFESGANCVLFHYNNVAIGLNRNTGKILEQVIYVKNTLQFNPNSASYLHDPPTSLSVSTRRFAIKGNVIVRSGPYCFFGGSPDTIQSFEIDGATFQGTNWDLACYALPVLHDITFKNCTFVAITAVNRTFANCPCLESLDLSDMDFSGITAQNGFLKNNYNLVNFSGVNVGCNLDLSTLYMLSHQSAVNVIDKLLTVSETRTLTLATAVKNTLTAEEIAVATAKGWTVA